MQKLRLSNKQVADKAGLNHPYVLYRWLEHVDCENWLLCETSQKLSKWYTNLLCSGHLRTPAEAFDNFHSSNVLFSKYLATHAVDQRAWVEYAHTLNFQKYMSLLQHQTVVLNKTLQSTTIPGEQINKKLANKKPAKKVCPAFPFVSQLIGGDISRQRICKLYDDTSAVSSSVSKNDFCNAALILLEFIHPLSKVVNT